MLVTVIVSFSLSDMSVNSSNLFQPNASFTSSRDFFYCYVTDSYPLIYITYSIMSLVLLSPVLILVLYLGLQQWRQQQRSASADGTLTNSDVFTLHLAIVELFGIFGSLLISIGIFKKDKTLVMVGSWPFDLTWYSETSFHVLTSMECYLAVVYPIRYQSLRRERRITIRNVSIVCAWLLSVVETSLIKLCEIFLFVDIFLFTLIFLIASYCSFSVLYILGKKLREQRGNKDWVCRRKLTAYYTVLAMLLVLLLRFTIDLIWTNVDLFLQSQQICGVVVFQTWLNLPSRLALPVRFLHRSGILEYHKSRN